MSQIQVKCKSCKDEYPDIVEDFKQGTLVCGNCGLILSSIIDTRSEWRNFSGEQDPSRVGAPNDPLLSRQNLDTMIGDSKSSLQRAHQRSGNRSDYVVYSGFKDIENFADIMGLPKTIADIAKDLYRRCVEEHLAKGKNPEVVKAVCLFIACRQSGVSRTFKDLSSVCRVELSILGKVFKQLQKSLNIQTTRVAGVASEDHIPRYVSQLQLSSRVEKLASEIATKAREITSLSSRSPSTIAGAALLMACELLNEEFDLKEISMICSITEGTVRAAYKIMLTHRTALYLSIDGKTKPPLISHKVEPLVVPEKEKKRKLDSGFKRKKIALDDIMPKKR